MSTLEEFLEQNYIDPKKAGSFFGPVKLRLAAKTAGYNPPLSFIKKWLNDRESYGLHKQTRRPRKTLRIVVSGPGATAHADLADVSDSAEFNDGVKFLLVFIDVFSKRAWVTPLKSKTATEVKDALEMILTQHKFNRVTTDAGGEFVNAKVAKMLKGLGVKHTIARNQGKAVIAERFIRTFRGKLSKYLEHYNTKAWIQDLDKITQGYNATIHRTTGIAPDKMTQKKAKVLWWKIYKPRGSTPKVKPFAFSIGDNVRVSRLKGSFAKESEDNWSRELFKIKRRFRKQSINLYQLEDWLGSDIVGTWYASELSAAKADPETMWRVERVIKHRKSKGVKQALIKWLGWGERVSFI